MNRLTLAEAAAYCGVTKQWLYQCRANGTGPYSFTKYSPGEGKGPSIRVYYYTRNLDAWNKRRGAIPRQQLKKAA
jgi:hypothetical protein